MVGFPESIIAGETLTVCVVCSSAESVVAYVVGTSKATITFELEDSKWKGVADTSEWEPGAYRYEVWVTNSENERRVLERGGFVVIASLEDVDAGTDLRSNAVKMVEMIEAMLAGNATAGVKRYKINNRELERYSLDELMELLDYWKNRVRLEDRKASGAPRLGHRITFRI